MEFSLRLVDLETEKNRREWSFWSNLLEVDRKSLNNSYNRMEKVKDGGRLGLIICETQTLGPHFLKQLRNNDIMVSRTALYLRGQQC